MASIEIKVIREKYPGLTDQELAAIYAKDKGYSVIVRYKSSENGEYNNFGLCKSPDETVAYKNSPYCHDTEIIYDSRNNAETDKNNKEGEAATIRFQCPQCSKTLEGKESWAGLELQCPSCNSPVVVPDKRQETNHLPETVPEILGKTERIGQKEESRPITEYITTETLKPFGNRRRLAQYGKYLSFHDHDAALEYFNDWKAISLEFPPSRVVEIHFVQFNDTFWQPEGYGIIHPEEGKEDDILNQWANKCKGMLNGPAHRPTNYGSNEYNDVKSWIHRVLDWHIIAPSDYFDNPSKYAECLVDWDPSHQAVSTPNSDGKIPCGSCGRLILQQTAQRTGGVCMPCFKVLG